MGAQLGVRECGTGHLHAGQVLSPDSCGFLSRADNECVQGRGGRAGQGQGVGLRPHACPRSPLPA